MLFTWAFKLYIEYFIQMLLAGTILTVAPLPQDSYSFGVSDCAKQALQVQPTTLLWHFHLQPTLSVLLATPFPFLLTLLLLLPKVQGLLACTPSRISDNLRTWPSGRNSPDQEREEQH